ncbi:MAG: DUF4832 domain-containing protein [Lachnospiraceae bacterium]|nr:DUF4832 domain-containing protein [Lachnospiraceae bacterium]
MKRLFRILMTFVTAILILLPTTLLVLLLYYNPDVLPRTLEIFSGYITADLESSSEIPPETESAEDSSETVAQTGNSHSNFYQEFYRLYGFTLQKLYEDSRYHVDYSPAEFKESGEYLDNPYQGFYRLYGYTLQNLDEHALEKQITDIRQAAAKDTHNLVLIEINLKNYSNRSISSAALEQLDEILSVWSSCEHQILLRFLYDWDGKATKTEPQNIDTVYEHIDQLAPTVNRYADSIYIMQGIFLGNHAEMHGSRFSIEENMIPLFEHLAQATDSSIYLSTRTPAQWRMIANTIAPLSENEAYSGSMLSRLGLYNDGMLGSENDLGTYGTDNLSGDNLSLKGTREEELAFQNELCRYVPNGGEVVINNTYNDFESAVASLSQMHVSYLSSIHDDAVLNKWKSTYYYDDVFGDITGYDYIERHLGYRYVLRCGALSPQGLLNRDATFEITVENVGFSNSYVSFPISLHIRNEESNVLYSYTPDTGVSDKSCNDTRFWNSGETATLSFPIPISTLGTGHYSVYLEIIDPISNKPIKFANVQEETISDGYYFLGEFTVSK